MGSKEELHLLSRPAGRIVIDRDEIDQADVDELRFVAPSVSKKERLVGCGKTLVGDLFPPAKWLPKYQKSFLPGDLISGMTVAMIRLPQGLAYGLLAGLAPINGVYLEFFQCIVYSLLSTVPQNSVGTFSIIALMTGSVLDKHFPAPPNATEFEIDARTSNGVLDYNDKLEMALCHSWWAC